MIDEDHLNLYFPDPLSLPKNRNLWCERDLQTLGTINGRKAIIEFTVRCIERAYPQSPFEHEARAKEAIGAIRQWLAGTGDIQSIRDSVVGFAAYVPNDTHGVIEAILEAVRRCEEAILCLLGCAPPTIRSMMSHRSANEISEDELAGTASSAAEGMWWAARAKAMRTHDVTTNQCVVNKAIHDEERRWQMVTLLELIRPPSADLTWSSAELVSWLARTGFSFCPDWGRPLPSLLPAIADCRAVLVCTPELDANAAIDGVQALEGRTVDGVAVTNVTWELIEPEGLFPRILKHQSPRDEDRRWLRCQRLTLERSGWTHEVLLMQTGLSGCEAALHFVLAHRLLPEKIVQPE
ncbi:MAG: hypothetical protein C5B50_17570 [Verrucomicrobia bacterium]|nr:MAG: hypothetical protein C5B50_17570 [Verrucomicrobiota bacterium]